MSVDVAVEAPAVLPPILAYLDAVRARHAGNDGGDVATYIPELATVDPSLFGICLATTGGALYEVGDTSVPFTLQSISKPLTYGLALTLVGEARVRERVGVEPSGDPFNEVSLDPIARIPVNPMINAGGIACVGLVVDAVDDGESVLLDTYSSYAGRRLAIDEAVYRSEAETGHRNRAIARLLRSVEVLGDDPDGVLDLYFRQYSVAVDCRDLALMAATLANGGVNPRTGERAVREDVVRRVLSVMAPVACTTAQASGWSPSASLPRAACRAACSAFCRACSASPCSRRPSTRRETACEGSPSVATSPATLRFTSFARGEQTAPPVRGLHTLREVRSRRVRSPDERAAINDAERTAVFELQGELSSSGAGCSSSTSSIARSNPASRSFSLASDTSTQPAGYDLPSTGCWPGSTWTRSTRCWRER